jgi:hypothetical protein
MVLAPSPPITSALLLPTSIVLSPPSVVKVLSTKVATPPVKSTTPSWPMMMSLMPTAVTGLVRLSKSAVMRLAPEPPMTMLLPVPTLMMSSLDVPVSGVLPTGAPTKVEKIVIGSPVPGSNWAKPLSPSTILLPSPAVMVSAPRPPTMTLLPLPAVMVSSPP